MFFFSSFFVFSIFIIPLQFLQKCHFVVLYESQTKLAMWSPPCTLLFRRCGSFVVQTPPSRASFSHLLAPEHPGILFCVHLHIHILASRQNGGRVLSCFESLRGGFNDGSIPYCQKLPSSGLLPCVFSAASVVHPQTLHGKNCSFPPTPLFSTGPIDKKKVSSGKVQNDNVLFRRCGGSFLACDQCCSYQLNATVFSGALSKQTTAVSKVLYMGRKSFLKQTNNQTIH